MAQQASKQYEQLEYQTECERIIAELIKDIPAHLQKKLEFLHLRPLFEIKGREDLMPKRGSVLSQVTEFPPSSLFCARKP